MRYRITMTETITHTRDFTEWELLDLGLGANAIANAGALRAELEQDEDTEYGVVDALIDNGASLSIEGRSFRVRVIV